MTGDDISELAERLDRIATALELTVSVSTNPDQLETRDAPHRTCSVFCMPSCFYPKCLA